MFKTWRLCIKQTSDLEKQLVFLWKQLYSSVFTAGARISRLARAVLHNHLSSYITGEIWICGRNTHSFLQLKGIVHLKTKLLYIYPPSFRISVHAMKVNGVQNKSFRSFSPEAAVLLKPVNNSQAIPQNILSSLLTWNEVKNAILWHGSCLDRVQLCVILQMNTIQLLWTWCHPQGRLLVLRRLSLSHCANYLSLWG